MTIPDAFNLLKKNESKRKVQITDILGTCGHCGAQLDADNSSILQSGALKHIGCWAKAIKAPGAPDANPDAAPTAPMLEAPGVKALVEAFQQLTDKIDPLQAPPAPPAKTLPVFDYDDENHEDWLPVAPKPSVARLPQVIAIPPVTLPAVTVPDRPANAAPVATPEPIQAQGPAPALPPTKAKKTRKAAAEPGVPGEPGVKKARKVKPPVLMWWATVGAGRWGPFSSQHEAWESATLVGAAATALAENMMAGKGPIYNGFTFINIGGVGVPRWVLAGLVVYPERAL
jgi:hypothetical protein